MIWQCRRKPPLQVTRPPLRKSPVRATDLAINCYVCLRKSRQTGWPLISAPGVFGVQPFFMGTTREGPTKGYAYWSVTCAGANSYMIQIAPNGQGAAVDCQTLKAQGQGRECYKTF